MDRGVETGPDGPVMSFTRILILPPIETFATGLEQDGAAVRAALTLPWCNGQAEGQVNHLKPLKRQSYGRASFDLLRRRVLMAT